MTEKSISKQTFIEWLRDGGELAVLDIRTPEEVGYASPLFATNLPAAQVAAELNRFVPRKTVRTVLVDDGSGAAATLIAGLAAKGWTDLHALEGGIPAWVEGGTEALPTFDIPGVPFVTKIREEKITPVISAEELKAWRDAGEDVVVLDSRTLAEFDISHVPGAIAVPGAELLLRFNDLVSASTTKVVISCAGLPRAILGAQTLIDAGIGNFVAYLDEGTRGWTNAGYPLESGRTASYGPATDTARRFAGDHAKKLSGADDLHFIDRETAAAWAADRQRTTYLLDVRTPEEFAAGHLLETISAEGGQLLGVAYRTIAVRGARVVLVDDPAGIRARTVAHWLKRRGYEIALLLHDFAASDRAAA